MAVACAVLSIALASLSKQELTVQKMQLLEGDLAAKKSGWGNQLLLGEKLAGLQFGEFAIALVGVVLATLPQRR